MPGLPGYHGIEHVRPSTHAITMNTDKNYTRTILITGGAGFIGANYLNTMVPRYPDHFFVNVDALTYAADLANISVSGSKNYAFEKADIREMSQIEGIFDKYSPTHVIHFAAESHVDNSITGPRVFVETNVLGTQNLLELARKYKIARFHHISTDEVYGSLALSDAPSTEHDLLRPNSPYSASKAAAEHIVRAYHETFGLDTVITRASNNYGAHQHIEKLIPRFITNLKAGKKVPVYGKGENVRDWLSVGDHVEGIDIVFTKGVSGEIYNLGGGNQLTNIAITKKILDLMGLGEEMIEHVPDRLGHDLRYALDITKAKNELGWTPKKDFEQGLKETVDFYLKR